MAPAGVARAHGCSTCILEAPRAGAKAAGRAASNAAIKASLERRRMLFSENACVIAPRLRSGCKHQTASDGEWRWGARRSHHAAELRDEPRIADTIRHRSNRQTAMEWKWR